MAIREHLTAHCDACERVLCGGATYASHSAAFRKAIGAGWTYDGAELLCRECSGRSTAHEQLARDVEDLRERVADIVAKLDDLARRVDAT